ncbi:MAG TPA: hypothetical protein VGN17_05235 [Bryobacteraceae bacterium]|jgi:hypothetical protein
MRLENDQLQYMITQVVVLLARRLGGGQDKTPFPRLMTLEQTAVYIGRTKSAVEKMVFHGKLDGCLHRIDRRVYVDRWKLDRMIEAKTI